MSSVERQLQTLGRALEAEHGTIEAEEILSTRSVPSGVDWVDESTPLDPHRRSTWMPVAAAVASVLLIAGLLYAATDDDDPSFVPIDRTVTTELPSTSIAPTTVPPVVADTDETTPLVFSPTSPPSQEWPSRGYSVSGRFYVAFGADLYWTADGEDWALDTEFGGLQPSVPDGWTTSLRVSGDGDRLVVVATPAIRSLDLPRYECVAPGDELTVSVRDSSGTWTTSRVAIPTVDAGMDPECTPVTGIRATIGPRGVIVVVQGYGGFGYPDDHEQYPSMAEDTRHSTALWSADGLEWTDIGAVPPFVSSVDGGPVAGNDAFYASVDTPQSGSGDRVEVTYRSDDGVNWVEDPTLPSLNDTHPGSGVAYPEFGWWNDRLVQNRDEGVLLYEDSELILSDGATVPASELGQVGRRFFGDQWIFGGRRGGYGDDIPDESFSFSPDGSFETAWRAPELSELEGHIRVIGVAHDYVVLSLYDAQPEETQLWIGRVPSAQLEPAAPTTPAVPDMPAPGS
jgi:hypothetical protein